MEFEIESSGYARSLKGIAEAESAVFTEVFRSPQGDTKIEYEFKDIRPVSETEPGELAQIPEWTFAIGN